MRLAAPGRLLLYAFGAGDHPALACDFNRSTQHLISKYREEDVEYEVQTEELLINCGLYFLRVYCTSVRS